MKTFLQICEYISLMPNSELGEVATMTDVSAEEKNAINRALLVTWNEVPKGNIRFAKTNFTTQIGVSNYVMPNGTLIEKGLKYNGNLLQFETNPEELAASSGTPDRFYIEGNEIVLYPTPIAVGTVAAKYRNSNAVKTAGGVEQAFFVNSSDVLNISRAENEFIECLGHLTNKLLNADQTDEEYLEHDLRYKLALSILKQVDTGTEENTARFVL